MGVVRADGDARGRCGVENAADRLGRLAVTVLCGKAGREQNGGCGEATNGGRTAHETPW